MLWLIRRPFSRKAQRRLLRSASRGRHERILKNEQFARRHGLAILTGAFLFALYFLALVLLFELVLLAFQLGWLPSSLSEGRDDGQQRPTVR